MKKLRWLRILLAWAAITWVTGAFLGFARTFPAKQQLFPAMLMGNLLAVGVILAGTALFGRFYCSVICPLGIFQDGVRFVAEKINASKRNFHYKKEKRKLRYAVLVIFAIGLVGGAGTLPMLLEPYSSYGLMVSNLLVPVWHQLVNFVSDMAVDYKLIEKYDVVPVVSSAVAFAAAYFVIIFTAAWYGGRNYCHMICPVGTILGTLSRFAVFHPYIDGKKCINCGHCEKICSSSCVDVKTGTVDTSMCVDCMDCIAVCPTGAMTFGHPNKETKPAENGQMTEKHATSMSRRAFLATGASAVGAAATALTLKTKTVGAAEAASDNVVMPPGAETRERFASLCSACQLCVEHCKGGVLRPANLEYGIEGIFQPRLDFTNGFCDYNCSQCGKVCPTGAVTKLPIKKKRKVIIGKAIYHHFNCLILKEGIECGNCVTHCPTKAVTLTGEFDKKKLPKVDSSLCIGCGSCEYHCPAKPKAIIITGLSEQTKLAVKEKTEK